MPSYKLGRTTEDIRREVSAILRELKGSARQRLHAECGACGGHKRPFLLHSVCQRHEGMETAEKCR